MKIIDEHGNLFGTVNVIDALAVVLVLAVVVAGVAFVGVLGPSEEEDEIDEPTTETRYATIDLGTQSISTAGAVATGDSMTDDRGQDFTITDVYAIPVSDTQADVTVRAEITGSHDEDGAYTFGGDEITSGANVSIRTGEYDVTGDIETVEDGGSDLPIGVTGVLLEETVAAETADAIQDGEELRFSDEIVATIDSAAVYPIADGEYRVRIGATLTTLERGGDLRYGQSSVEPGSTIALATDGYVLEPTVIDTNVTEEPGEETTTTVEIDLDELGDREADLFESGLAETAGGETWATVTGVNRGPASVIVETDDGELHERQHPTHEDVTLTVTLETREIAHGHELSFKGEPLRNGDTVYLDFGVASVEERVWIVDDS